MKAVNPNSTWTSYMFVSIKSLKCTGPCTDPVWNGQPVHLFYFILALVTFLNVSIFWLHSAQSETRTGQEIFGTSTVSLNLHSHASAFPPRAIWKSSANSLSEGASWATIQNGQNLVQKQMRMICLAWNEWKGRQSPNKNYRGNALKAYSLLLLSLRSAVDVTYTVQTGASVITFAPGKPPPPPCSLHAIPLYRLPCGAFRNPLMPQLRKLTSQETRQKTSANKHHGICIHVVLPQRHWPSGCRGNAISLFWLTSRSERPWNSWKIFILEQSRGKNNAARSRL